MHRAEGPITTGTYIAITRVNNQDQITKAGRTEIGHEAVGTNDRNDEDIEVRTISTSSCMHFPSVFSSSILRALETTILGFTTRKAELASYLQATLRAPSSTRKADPRSS